MKKDSVLIAIFLTCQAATGYTHESMEELTRRVFGLAVSQFELLDSQLDERQTPKTLDVNGNLAVGDIRWWCSGFFPGSLWLTYEYSGNSVIRTLAEKRTLQLAPLMDIHTDHDIGFMINCSYGNALRITADTATYRSTILRAADKLAGRFVPRAGIIRSWDGAWTDRNGWDIPVIIDNMMNLELLMNAHRMSGKEGLLKVATSHANATISHHFRPDYGTYHLVDYSSSDGSVRRRQTHQGYADETTWARGEAWALYGFTMMYMKTGNEQYFKQADYIAKYIIRNLPENGVPYWDFSRVGELRDASAAAIMASAFVQLYEITGDSRYLCVADRQIRTLASKEYLSEPGMNHGFLLMHGVGNLPGKSEVDVPLTYADYYFLEALLRRQRATSHPRLFIDTKSFDCIRRQLKEGSNKAVSLMHANIMHEADEFPDSPIIWGLDESGTRILTQSRTGLKRILYDAYAYRFTCDGRYLEHAEKTLNQLCDMPDWNGWHFLDVAEMAAALAIGYDWLYDALSPELKRRMVRTIKEYAFIEAFDLNKAWFYDSAHNWNQVCNGGLAMAALAFREDCGKVAGNIVRNAVRTNGRKLETIYGPDGCYPEGPSYWNYGNTYQLLLNSCFDSALGDDFGLSSAKGFDRSGDFVVNCYGAHGKMFNYYDNSLQAVPSIPLWYFAWRFDKPYLLEKEMKYLESGSKYYNKDSKIIPVIIGYASKINIGSIKARETGMYVGHGSNPIATIHGTDSDGEWFLGVKGGKAANNHGHADAGSFVFDQGGVRWAADPGMVQYTKAENGLKAKGGNFWDKKQNSLRWTIYPIGNEWHNTLTVNGKRHTVDSSARITFTADEPEVKTVKIDFGKLLGDDIASAERTFELHNGRLLTISDSVQTVNDSHICFTLVSEADAEIRGNRLILRSGNRKMELLTSGAKPTISFADCPGAVENGLKVVKIEYDIAAGRACCFKTIIKKY